MTINIKWASGTFCTPNERQDFKIIKSTCVGISFRLYFWAL